MMKQEEESDEKAAALIIVFLLWILFNMLGALAGASERGSRYDDCENRPTLRYDYIFPGYAFGCWLGLPAEETTD